VIVALRILFAAIFASMLAVTVQASLDRGVVEALRDLWPDPWFRATLADAYFGFLTVYAWVAYRERGWLGRAVWFVLFMGLGNFAIASYMLIRLLRVPRGASISEVLLRPEAAS
jgi:hypothetical protein